MDLERYAEELKGYGRRVIPGSERSLWVSHSRFAMQRQPVFALHTPAQKELHEVFRRSWASVLSFATTPSDLAPPNGYLYLCQNPRYSIESLGRSARSKVRCGLREFEIRFMPHSEFLSKGAQAYCDTIRRNGFRGRYTAQDFATGYFHLQPGTKYVGAFRDSSLAAFLMVVEVDDWVSIGSFSADEFLPLRPNNGLLYFAVRHYLCERKMRVVSYGLSSLQTRSNAEGLHVFKVNMGFDAMPIRRGLVVNPLLRPLVNGASWVLVKSLLRLSRNHPLLRKAEGAMRMALPASHS